MDIQITVTGETEGNDKIPERMCRKWRLEQIKFSLLSFCRYLDGRIILRLIFRKLEGVVGTGWSWLRIGTGCGHL
jgi:hypothetical protein